MDIIDLLEKEIEADIKDIDEEDPERCENRKKLGAVLREAIKGTELEKEMEELEKEMEKLKQGKK